MLQKFLLKHEKSTSGKIHNVLTAFILCLLWVIFVKVLLVDICDYPVLELKKQLTLQMPEETLKFAFLSGVIIAPLWEETAYRWFPMQVSKWFGKHTLFPIIIISSIIFGWGHGYGQISLLIQGVSGFILACLYVKNGFSFWSSVALHTLWNFMMMFGFAYLFNF